MSNGIDNVRRWAYSYAESYKAMPSKQDIDAMASANGILSHIVSAMVQMAIMEMEDREFGISSLDELDGIGDAI